MGLTINDTAPDFTAQSTEGEIHFHDWIGDSWAVLFSHPKDFTPVCTTELGYMARIKPEFDRRNVKIIGISVDSTSDHEGWAFTVVRRPNLYGQHQDCVEVMRRDFLRHVGRP